MGNKTGWELGEISSRWLCTGELHALIDPITACPWKALSFFSFLRPLPETNP